jgi:hypothetical protein
MGDVWGMYGGCMEDVWRTCGRCETPWKVASIMVAGMPGSFNHKALCDYSQERKAQSPSKRALRKKEARVRLAALFLLVLTNC